MRGRAELVEPGPVRERVLEQPEPELSGENPGDSVIDTAHRHPSGLDLAAQRVDEFRIVTRHHDHVEAGVDRGAYVARVVAGQPVDRLPVADDEAVEAEPPL